MLGSLAGSAALREVTAIKDRHGGGDGGEERKPDHQRSIDAGGEVVTLALRNRSSAWREN